MNYTPYHIHTDCSILDSCTQYDEYIKKAKEYGITSLAFTEHGNISNWIKKYLACKKNGIKYIHGVECYITENLGIDNIDERSRNNYHTVLLAKNRAGFEEINSIINKSYQDDHFYYKPRISFDEFLNISNNVITTSACIKSPLNKIDIDNPYYLKLIERYDYLEIQPHNHPEQKAFNINLACLAKIYNKPLIMGTDSHSISQYKAECRDILLSYKNINNGSEDTFDLVFKSYEELKQMCIVQDCFPQNIYDEAINNTNIMAEMIEDYNISDIIKYPLLYGSREKDHEMFIERINEKFEEKIKNGIIPEYQIENFKKAITEELDVFTKTNMDGFMLSMSEIIDWCHQNNIITGPARGSVAGSRIAYITDIIDLNPETFNTVFSRFANVNRKEVGDIDTDVDEADRPKIFKHVIERFGSNKCARVSAFGTLADKAVIEVIYKAKANKWEFENPNEPYDVNPYRLDIMKATKKDYGNYIDEITKKYKDDKPKYKQELENAIILYENKYPEIFKYYRGLVGTKRSQSIHPAGMVICCDDLITNFGTFNNDGDNCLFIDMEECHDIGLVKYDFLCLGNIKIIRDTFKMVGKEYPKFHEMDWNDQDVWKHITDYPEGIFQFESDFAFQQMNKFQPRSIQDLSLVTAAIRPGGVLYRDDLMKRIEHHNPSTLIDNLLKDNYGYLVYQEDVIKFLEQACGFDGSSADTMRRAIADSKWEWVEPQLPKVIDGYCNKSGKPRDVAEKEAMEFVKVIESASRYMFGYNHSIAYCLVSYLCAYLRYHYTGEFITTLLNNPGADGDIEKFTTLANKYHISVTTPKYGVSQSGFSYNKELNQIAKGLSSIKYISDDVADSLYKISNSENPPTTFVDLIYRIKNETKINSKQLDILIKINFFSKFGNVRELSQILNMFEIFNFGNKINISKDKITKQEVIDIISPFANFGLDKKGKQSKNWQFQTTENVIECARQIEIWLKSLKLKDISQRVQISNYQECLGYVPATNNPEDKMVLIISDVAPVTTKNGKIWQYRIGASSLGSGKSARLSLSNEMFTNYPISNGSIIKANEIKKDEKGYWHLTNYIVL